MNENLVTALRSISKPIFAATRRQSGSGLDVIVHVAAVADRAELREQVTKKAIEAGAHRVWVQFHNASELSAPRSLEKFVARVTGGEILYDPTGAIARGRAIVEAGRMLRRTLGVKLSGIFYESRTRTLFVTLKAPQVLSSAKVRVSALSEIENAVGNAVANAFVNIRGDSPSVRVGFGVPHASLVPVDRRSVIGWSRRAVSSIRRNWKPVTLATLFGLGAVSSATASGPAVSESNLKVTVQGGQSSDESAWVAAGAVTLPIGQNWGLQAEGGASGVDGNTSIGAAAHIFTRDPDSHLLGVFVAHANEDEFDLDATRLGAEAEIYLNQVTLLAKAGYQFSDSIGDTAFANIDLRWYASDSFAITAGGDFIEDSSVGRLEIEYMPGFSALPGLAFNVRGAVGEDDYDSILGGITYYFGSDASLRDRHRKQDPDSALFSLFKSVEQERAALAAQYGNPT